MFVYYISLIIIIFTSICSNVFGQEGGESVPSGGEEEDICGEPQLAPVVSLKDVPQTRIINGDDARPHSWPWQVSIQRKTNIGTYIHICGGSLVSQSKVISAAHCLLYSDSPNDYVVVLGSHNLNKREPDRKIYNIAEFILPKEDNLKKIELPFDIVVITLARDIQYSAYISPVCLSDKKTIPLDLNCYVTGWGKNISQSSDSSSSTLKQLGVPIINPSICQKAYNNETFNPKRHICSGFIEGGKDTCQGDSGGPLVCIEDGRWYLYGVVSSGFGCAQKNKPGIYTRISFYYNWLLKQL